MNNFLNIDIPFSSLNDNIKKDYLAGNIKSISIDYQFNGIFGYIEDKEVELFSFDRYFRADNRYNSYELHATNRGILLEITSKKVV